MYADGFVSVSLLCQLAFGARAQGPKPNNQTKYHLLQ